MKRSPLSRGTSQLKRSPLRKSGKTKEKKVARQKAFYSSAAWKKLRKEALERAGNRCEYIAEGGTVLNEWEGPMRCTTTTKLEIHHRVSVRFGGDERPTDLVCYCSQHHRLIEYLFHPHRQRSR